MQWSNDFAVGMIILGIIVMLLIALFGRNE